MLYSKSQFFGPKAERSDRENFALLFPRLDDKPNTSQKVRLIASHAAIRQERKTDNQLFFFPAVKEPERKTAFVERRRFRR